MKVEILIAWMPNIFALLLTVDLQKDNVANQREHLILLLANVHIRQFPKPDQQPKVWPLYPNLNI